MFKKTKAKAKAKAKAKTETKLVQYDVGFIFKSELANIEVAGCDYCDGTKHYFNYEETKQLEKKLKDGWRLPTRHEMVLLCEEFGQNDKGQLDPELLRNNLLLRHTGFYHKNTDSVVCFTSSGYWRTFTKVPRHEDVTYLLTVSSYEARVSQIAWEDDGYAIRLVRDIKGN